MNRIVYLLHFAEPIAHAQHYIGSTTHLEQRIDQHRSGHGARLPAVFAERGISFTVAQIWNGDRSEERRIKRMKMARRICPICREAKRHAAS